MKINDLTNENKLYNWMARHGLFGTEKGIKATGEYLSGQQQAASQASIEMAKKRFKQQLHTALISAINSGLVDTSLGTPLPESYTYDAFNKLLENKILNEASSAAISVKEFLTNYLTVLLKNFNLSAEHKTQLNKLIDGFSGFKVNTPLPKQADQLYDLISVIKQTQGEATIADPDTDELVSTTRGQYKFDKSSSKWYLIRKKIDDPRVRSGYTLADLPPPGREIVDVNLRQQLNKLARTV